MQRWARFKSFVNERIHTLKQWGGVYLHLESLPSKCVQHNGRIEHIVPLVLAMQRWPQLKSIVNKRIHSETFANVTRKNNAGN